MTTVLLWGDRWWLPHHKLPIPFAEPSQAARVLASAWPDKSKTIRLVYQPDDLVSSAATCPNANRSTLALVLAEEHPALAHPGHVWSHEPILARGDGFGTLLHYETRPTLFGLVQRLEEHGFAVSSVWPMSTWLNALPPELSESGALTVCAVHSDAFCLYRHSADGRRTVRTGRGDEALNGLTAHLQELSNHAGSEFILYVTTDDSLIEALNERVPLVDTQITGIFSLPEALAKSAPLPTNHPAQLLPPVPKVTAPRLVFAASTICLAVTLTVLAWYGREYLAGRADHDARQVQKQRLRSEIAHLQSNAEEISRLRTQIVEIAGSPPITALLEQLSATAPRESVLTSLRITADGFTATGWLPPDSSTAEANAWSTRLTPPGAAWKMSAIPSTTVGRFELRGQFQ